MLSTDSSTRYDWFPSWIEQSVQLQHTVSIAGYRHKIGKCRDFITTPPNVAVAENKSTPVPSMKVGRRAAADW